MPANPRRTRRLALGAVLAAALLLVAGHTLLWLWLCGRLEAGFAEWAAAREAAGWRVEHGTPSRGGWPFAATVTLPELGLRGGDSLAVGGVDWRTEALTLRLGPPRIDRLALAAPGRHRLRVGGLEVPFSADRLDASFPLAGPLAGGEAPDEAAASARRLRFDVTGGPVEVAAAAVEFATASAAAGPVSTLRAVASDLALPPGLPGSDRLGRAVDRLGLDLALTGAIPPGRSPARQAAAWRDGGGGLEIRALDARWGEAAASAAATLALDGALQPEGAGALRLTGGEALLDAASAAGLLPPFAAAAARIALRGLTRPPAEGASGPGQAVLLLSLADRTLKLGPATLVRLPVLRWNGGLESPSPR
jgi:hypothetical protein